MLLKSGLKCRERECIKPTGRRLGLFRANDEYECYSESYVKCFWGMCDHHKSMDDFTTVPEVKVITKQPISDNGTKIITLKNPALFNDMIVSKK